ncbi:adenylate/guanylate cyclase domain-containing protein [soil metagenome]
MRRKPVRRQELIGHYALSYGLSIGTAIPFYLWRQVNPFFTILLFGTIFGSVFALLDYSGIGRWKHPSFIVTTLARTLAYGAGIVISLALSTMVMIYAISDMRLMDPELWETYRNAILNGYTLLSACLGLLVAFAISSVIAISKKLGPGVLMRWITGRYHTPRAEERVFMFLDIRDSTTLAETLGDLRFSSLVRDFMADLSEPVIQTRAEVSHYIGDDAVLVWIPERAFQNDACIRLFSLLRERLEERAPHYTAAYGAVPSFKAGIHMGTAIVTEVGEIKSEIVYHGDTLNTTARIQGLCNELGYDLLVSETVAERLGEKGQEVGRHALKGKAEPVSLRGFVPFPAELAKL